MRPHGTYGPSTAAGAGGGSYERRLHMRTEQAVSIGELLRGQRVAAGRTQEELAERAHLSWRGISDLERGVRRAPYRETVRLLAAALGLAGTDRTAFALAARPAIQASAPPAVGRLTDALRLDHAG